MLGLPASPAGGEAPRSLHAHHEMFRNYGIIRNLKRGGIEGIDADKIRVNCLASRPLSRCLSDAWANANNGQGGNLAKCSKTCKVNTRCNLGAG